MLYITNSHNLNILHRTCKSVVLIIAVGLLLLFSIAEGNENSEAPSGKTNKNTISGFYGEKLIYDINFLWFKDAAEGSIILERDNKDKYVATLKAETKGFVGFFTGYIKHLYISRMNVVGENIGFLPYLFEKNIIYKKQEEKITTTLDYENRIMSWTTIRKGKIVNATDVEDKKSKFWSEMKKNTTREDGSVSIPPSITYYDILSAFYNFRTYYYGQISKGKDFLVNVIPEKEESDLHIHVCTLEEEMKFKKEEKIGEGDEGYFFIITVPKEIFKTKDGMVLVWGDKELLPLKVVVRNYIGFGDVRATLRKPTGE